MTDEKPSAKSTSLTSAEGISTFLEKNGIATFLLIAVCYVGWTSFLSPAAERYMKLLDAVTESNQSLAQTISELKQGMVMIGEKNTQLGETNARLLNDIDERLRDVQSISTELSRKLDQLKRPSAYTPPPSPSIDEE